jgi:hypothetical protein
MGQEVLPTFERLVVKGKAFQDVKVVAVESSGIRFMHATGAGRAKFEELDSEVIAKLGVDQAKMRDLALDEARAAALRPTVIPAAPTADVALKDAKWEMKSIKVAEKIGDGYLCYPHTPGGVKGVVARQFDSVTDGGSNYVRSSTNYDRPLYVTGIKGVAIGDALTGLATKVGIKEIDGQPYEHWMSKPD